jgi:hypothetical protein
MTWHITFNDWSFKSTPHYLTFICGSLHFPTEQNNSIHLGRNYFSVTYFWLRKYHLYGLDEVIYIITPKSWNTEIKDLSE